MILSIILCWVTGFCGFVGSFRASLYCGDYRVAHEVRDFVRVYGLFQDFSLLSPVVLFRPLPEHIVEDVAERPAEHPVLDGTFAGAVGVVGDSEIAEVVRHRSFFGIRGR